MPKVIITENGAQFNCKSVIDFVKMEDRAQFLFSSISTNKWISRSSQHKSVLNVLKKKLD